MKVALDIDGVLADFVSPFVKVLELRSGCAVDLESVTDPNFAKYPFLSGELITQCIMEVSDDPRFWRSLAPLPSAEQWEFLDALSREERLVFVTHRYERHHYSIHEVTSDWLREQGVSKPVVYFTQKAKSELVERLGVKVFVDDRHENCRDVAENTEAIVLMPHRCYNRSFAHPRVTRIRDLRDLATHLGERRRQTEGKPWDR
jgi:5'(3')-deoxyribonucleotidase